MVRVCEKMQIKRNNNLAQSREDFFLNLELAGFFFILKLCFLNTTDFNYYLSHIEIKTCFIVLFTLFCSFYLPCLRDNKAISVNVQSLRSMFKKSKTYFFCKKSIDKRVQFDRSFALIHTKLSLFFEISLFSRSFKEKTLIPPELFRELDMKNLLVSKKNFIIHFFQKQIRKNLYSYSQKVLKFL